MRLKAQFGSPPDEHLDVHGARMVFLPQKVGKDGVASSGKQVWTGLTRAELIWYYHVASKRKDQNERPDPWLVELIEQAERPSPLKVMWESKKIWSTLGR